MPMDRKAYPDDWEKISRFIRFERAGGRCEWCKVPHFAYREKGGDRWVTAQEIEEIVGDGGWVSFDLNEATLIILTVAHLGIAKPDGSPGSKEDRMDCRPENLAALCQRCHLNFDRPDNLKTQRRKRQQRRIEVDALFDYSIQ